MSKTNTMVSYLTKINVDLALLVAHRKKEAKGKRIILDCVKDHFISHILDKRTVKRMFDSLVELFWNSCASEQMLCETFSQ